MVLFFSLPIFAAYGTVFGSGILFYLWIAIVLPLFLIIPASVGVLSPICSFIVSRRRASVMSFSSSAVFLYHHVFSFPLLPTRAIGSARKLRSLPAVSYRHGNTGVAVSAQQLVGRSSRRTFIQKPRNKVSSMLCWRATRYFCRWSLLGSPAPCT